MSLRFAKFAEYFNYLAHRIFKKKLKPEESDIYKLSSALGPGCDDIKETIFTLREQALVATAAGKGLDLLGRDRKMPRYREEADEEYRRRLLAAVSIYSQVGTKPGMMRVLSILGYRDCEIYPLYMEKYKWRRLDSSVVLDGGFTLESLDPTAKLELLGHWAEFIVKLNLGDRAFLESHYLIAREMINRVKPSEGKLYAIQFSVAARTDIYLDTDTRGFLKGYFGSEVYGGVKFLDGRKTLSPSPLPLVLDGSCSLGGYVIDGTKGLPAGTWFISDSRTGAGMTLRQAAGAAPGIVLSLDGRYRLGGAWVLGANRHQRTGGLVLSLNTGAGRQFNSAAPGTGIKTRGRFPRRVVYLNAYYKRLNSGRLLNGNWQVAANRQINRSFPLSGGGVSHGMKGAVKTAVRAGGCWALGTGRWLLDGGSIKYNLDGYLKLSPVHRLNGSVILSGDEKICHLARLGEKDNALNGRLLWCGEILDGYKRLKPGPVSPAVQISVKKDGRIIEQGVI